MSQVGVSYPLCSLGKTQLLEQLVQALLASSLNVNKALKNVSLPRGEF